MSIESQRPGHLSGYLFEFLLTVSQCKHHYVSNFESLHWRDGIARCKILTSAISCPLLLCRKGYVPCTTVMIRLGRLPNRCPTISSWLHLSCGSSLMSNGNPDSSGHACPDTINEDSLPTFLGVDDCQSITHIEDWFDDVIFDFDGAVDSCEAQPDTVDLPLELDDIGFQSPFSTSALDQQPCAEADFLGTSYCPTTQYNVYGSTPDPQQSSDFLAFDNTTFDDLNGNPLLNQYAVARTSASSIPSRKPRPEAAQILETSALEHRALPNSSLAESQRPSYRYESQIAKVQSPSGQTTCSICGHAFARSKDLKRHKSTVHREDNDPVYLCRCGKDDPRKDNHGRHVKVCVNSPCMKPPGFGAYVCKCLHSSQKQDDHMKHVKSCSTGKRSRRRLNAS